MVQKRLIEAVSKDVSLSKSDAKRLVEAFFGQIQEALKRGESVVLREFGSFYPTPYDAFGSKAEKVIFETEMPPDEPVFKPGKALVDLFDTEPAASSATVISSENTSQVTAKLRKWLATPSKTSLSRIISFFEDLDPSLSDSSLIIEYALAHITTWPAALVDGLKRHNMDLLHKNTPHVFPSLVESVHFGKIDSYDLLNITVEDSWCKELQTYTHLKEIFISATGYTTDTTDTLTLDMEDEDYDEQYEELELENNKIRDDVIKEYEDELIAFCKELESMIPSIQTMHIEVRIRDERCECWFESNKTKQRSQQKWKSA